MSEARADVFPGEERCGAEFSCTQPDDPSTFGGFQPSRRFASIPDADSRAVRPVSSSVMSREWWLGCSGARMESDVRSHGAMFVRSAAFVSGAGDRRCSAWEWMFGVSRVSVSVSGIDAETSSGRILGCLFRGFWISDNGLSRSSPRADGSDAEEFDSGSTGVAVREGAGRAASYFGGTSGVPIPFSSDNKWFVPSSSTPTCSDGCWCAWMLAKRGCVVPVSLPDPARELWMNGFFWGLLVLS